MKISVVVSAYNGADYICEQLESIKNQTRPADEVLIFDDCSTDNTIEIVSEYIKNNKLDNWSISKNEKNYGWRKNFMYGMNKASGDLIFSADQDDIWFPNKFELMEKAMSENKDINVLTSAVEAFYDNGRTEIIRESSDEKIVRFTCRSDIFKIKYPGCTYCVRKSFFKKCFEYWKDSFPHDALFWRMAILDNSLAVYNEPLIRWRQHSYSAYAIESKKVKTKLKKTEWTFYAEDMVKSMQDFLDTVVCDKNELKKKRNLLQKNMNWIILKRKFYSSKNFIYGIRLLRYLGCYTSLKQYIGDWYITYMTK